MDKQAEIDETKEPKAEIEQVEPETDVVTETDVDEEKEPSTDEEAAKPGESEDPESDEDEGELIVSFGDTPSPDDDPENESAVIRDLRKRHREAVKKLKDLEAKVSETSGAAKPVELEPEPTLESCDWDEARFKRDLLSWQDKKRQVEQAENAKREEAEKQQKAWDSKLEQYKTAKTSLKLPDYDDSEAVIEDALNPIQQAAIINTNTPEQAAMLIYALGKNPAKLEELKKFDNDPMNFIAAVTRMAMEMKVTKSKAKPNPEKKLTGSGNLSGTVDSTLERLRAEAEKTGDYSKVRAHKEALKAKK